MDDRKIIELYFARSESALSETAKKHGRMCRRVAYNILRSNEDSEECVNDTYLRAWDSIPPSRPENLGAFLAKITRNLAINLWHKRQRASGNVTLCIDELAETIPDPKGEVTGDAELADAIERFLGTLKPQARVIFLRRYYYAYTISEIARGLSMSENAVKMQLSRTRADMRGFFEKEGISI